MVFGRTLKEKKDWIYTIANVSFYAAILIEVFIVIVDKSNYTNPIEGRLFQLTFVLCFVKVCLTRYTFREYGTIFLFGIVGVVSYFATGRNELLRLVMLIAACKDIDMRKCMKFIFWLTLTGCLGIIILSVTGIYGNMSLTMDFGRGEAETRYVLGMGHPNALQCMVWALTTLGLYLYAESYRWNHYMFVLIVNAFFFLLTNSRTSMLVAVFSVLLSYLLTNKKSEKISRISAISCIVLTIICVAGSVVIAGNAYRVYDYVWHGDRSPVTLFFAKLSDVLTGRIRILVENDTFEGTIKTWSLFSKPENDHFFDLGWVRLFYWYGIIPACIFVVVMLLIMLHCYQKRDYMPIMLITSFAVYTVIEAHGISVYLARNYVFFLLGGYWSGVLCGNLRINKKGILIKENNEKF